MTVKLLSAWGDYPVGALFTSTAATEAAMVAGGVATTVVAGGTVWPAPVVRPAPDSFDDINAKLNQVLVEDPTTGAVSLNPDAIPDGLGLGRTIYSAAGTYGLTFSGGANAPALVENINGDVWVTSPIGGYVEITLPSLADQLAPNNFYIEAESDNWNNVSLASYYLATTGYSKFWVRSFQATTSGITSEPSAVGSGARKFWSDRTSLAGTGSPDFASTMVNTHKFRVTAVAGKSARFCIKKVVFDAADAPSISITFDDGYISVFNNALPLLHERGLKATWGIIVDKVGQAPYASLANLRTWVAAGNECIPHGPNVGGSLNDYGSLPVAVADMVHHRDYLLNNALSDSISANVYIWPQGVYYLNGDMRDTSLIDAASAAGFTGARGTHIGKFFNTKIVGYSISKWNVPIIGHNAAATDPLESENIAGIIAKINELPSGNKSACLMFHYVGAGNGVAVDISTANFTLIVNAIHSLVSRGLILNPLFSRQVSWGG